MQHPIQDGIGQCWVIEIGMPMGRRQLTSDQGRSSADPIIEHLLRYREVEKLRSTYGTGLLAEVADDDRIHATFNQTVARTGRFSSDAPNLHRIPFRSEQG